MTVMIHSLLTFSLYVCFWMNGLFHHCLSNYLNGFNTTSYSKLKICLAFISVVPTNAKIGAIGKTNNSTNSITSAVSGTTTAAAKNYNQPDVVKVSSPAAPHPDLHRENLQLRERLGHSAKGFTAMAVALSHVSKEVCHEVSLVGLSWGWFN